MENNNLDIIQLIEKNPITRLSTKDYTNRFINKIKDNFTDIQQQMFSASFYCYLNHDNKKDFIIDFDDVWKWAGFARKTNGKTVLEKHFTIEIDYVVKNIATEVAVASLEASRGGQNREIIMLTINTFKKFCLKANTKKADEIHDYYIKLEELLLETVQEETNELKLQMEIQNFKLKQQNEKLCKNIKNRLIDKNNPGNSLYIISTNEIKDKIKIGSTNNIDTRITELSCGSPERFKILNIYYTNSYRILEETIKKVFSSYRISKNCEWYQISVMEKLSTFIEEYITLYDKHQECSEDNELLDIINEVHNDIIPLNLKKCINCNEVQENTNFFRDIDNKYFLEDCKTCYTAKNMNNTCSKQCNNCYIIKHTYEFDIERTAKDGLSYFCKPCKKDQRVKRKEENKNNEHNMIGKKECIDCKEYHYFKMFFANNKKDEPITYFDNCILCYNKDNGESKQCYTCKDVKNIIHYNKSAQCKDGLNGTCRDCGKKKRSENIQNKRETVEDTIGKKQCITCKENLKLIIFFKIFSENSDEYELYDECRNCYTPSSLQCNRCHEIKDVNLFGIDSTKTTGRRSICKSCTNERDRKRREENKK